MGAKKLSMAEGGGSASFGAWDRGGMGGGMGDVASVKAGFGVALF